eukprot:TRINITY_DN33592_c0_g1_i1.p1 TRINITY_DN33592_c0_g1~~TRINITY_DN33592_c0_g1_i1.p1  ORF type:complete len:1490 (-),score=268.99 TRINITY_DN33592_c0_g1_i1:90-4559(-)
MPRSLLLFFFAIQFLEDAQSNEYKISWLPKNGTASSSIVIGGFHEEVQDIKNKHIEIASRVAVLALLAEDDFLVDGKPWTIELRSMSVPQQGFLQAVGADEFKIRVDYVFNNLGVSQAVAPFSEENFETAAQEAYKAKTLLLGPDASDARSVKDRPNVFSMSRPHSKILLPVFRELYESGKADGPVGVSYISADWDRAERVIKHTKAWKICSSIPEVAAQANLRYLDRVEVSSSTVSQQLDKKPLAQKLVEKSPNVIVCCETYEVCIAFIREIRELDYNPGAIVMLESADPSVQNNGTAILNAALNTAAASSSWAWPRSQGRSGGSYCGGGGQDVNATTRSGGGGSGRDALDGGGDAVATSMFSLPPDELELLHGVLVVSDWDRSPSLAVPIYSYTPENFSRHFKSECDNCPGPTIEPSPEAAASFAGRALLMEAVRCTNSTDPVLIAKRLMQMNVETAYGRVRFDSDGFNAEEASTMQVFASHTSQGLPEMKLRFITPRGKPSSAAMQFPKSSWQNRLCHNTALENVRDNSYGYVEAKSGDWRCEVCKDGDVSSWIKENRSLFCRACGPGTTLEVEGEERQCELCGIGEFSSGNYTSCEKCPAGKYQGVPGQSYCLDCPAGKFTARQGAARCVSCTDVWDTTDKDAVVLWAPIGSVSCTACPEGAECRMDSEGLYTNYTNKAGYYLFEGNHIAEGIGWQNSPRDWGLFRCTHGDGKACQADGKCHVDISTGSETMTGPLCGSCRPGYEKPAGKAFALCQPCSELLWYDILGVLSQIAAILFVPACLAVVNAYTNYNRPNAVYLVVILKQLYNYFLMASLVFSSKGDHGLYGFDIDSIMNQIHDVIGGDSSGWNQLSGPCLARYIFPDFRLYKVWITISIAWFPVSALLSCIIFFSCSLAKRIWLSGKGLPTYFLKNWLILNVFLYLPRVDELLLNSLYCEYNFDSWRISYDTSVDCQSPDALIWLGVGWSSLACITIGFPVFLIYKIQRSRSKELHRDYATVKTFGFLTAGFEHGYLYFDGLYMIRRFCFQVIPFLPFMGSGSEARDATIGNALVAFVAAVFFAAHMAFQPFDNRGYFILDRLETASLEAILVTAFVQLVCLITNTADVIERFPFARDVRNIVCTAIILFFNVRFLWMPVWFVARTWVIGVLKGTAAGNLIGDQGSIQLHPHGLVMKGLSEDETMLFNALVSELVALHKQTMRKIVYNDYIGSLQFLCLASYKSRLRQELNTLQGLGIYLKRLHERIREKFGDDSILQRSFRRVVVWYESEQGIGGDTDFQQVLRNKEVALKTLDEWSAFTLKQVFGVEFRVHELHDCLIDHGENVCSYKGLAFAHGSTAKSATDWGEIFVGKMSDDKYAYAELRFLNTEKKKLQSQLEEMRAKLAGLENAVQTVHKRVSVSEQFQAVDMSEGPEGPEDLERLQVEFSRLSREQNRLRESMEVAIRQKLESEEEEALTKTQTTHLETRIDRLEGDIQALRKELKETEQ